MAGMRLRSVHAFLFAGALSAIGGRVGAGELSLYERMGGEPVVGRVVSDLIDHAASDPRTSRSFEGSNLARIKNLVAEQICDIADGGCRYSGDPMREVHAGQRISQAEFFAFTELLQGSLRRAGVGIAARNELVSRLAPMAREIVERPSGGGAQP